MPIKVEYSYDVNGNITSIIETNLEKGDITSTIILTYNNLNELTKIEDNGMIYNNTYTNGMLVNYMGWFIEYDMRNISSMESRNSYIEYDYNANSLRTKKTIDGVTTSYLLDGNNIIRETKIGTNGYTINYYYDINDSIIGFSYNTNYYMYLKNIQNDIIGIVDFSGNLVVEYVYDAYGNIINIIDESGIGLGTVNPFRYRSYYFDSETGWYYLNSRYYNPKLGRFVTMDEVEYLGASGTLLGYNLYSYCENNPVNYIDESGNLQISSLRDISWLFVLANMYSYDFDIYSKGYYESPILNINLLLFKIEISISVGLTSNYEAGYGFSFSTKSISISKNIGLGDNYSLVSSYTLAWGYISRSMSIVYTSTKFGVYVSLNLEFKISHIATLALVYACAYAPQLATVIKPLAANTKSAAIIGGKAIALLFKGIALAF